MTKDSSIRAVVFDFGNVICKFDNELFLRSLLSHTDKGFRELKEAIYASDLPRRYETGLVSSENFYREAVRLGNLSIPMEGFFRAFTDIFTPIPSTSALIMELKGKYKVGLLSNTNEWHYEHFFKSVEVFPQFDSVTLSFDVKEMKPGEGIYRDALGKLGVLPDECVYVDDIEEYAEGARRVGMKGIRYTSHDSLVASLRALGVSV
ncbi:MAG: haloacid dehalogenase domain protein hydrolase [Actinobacteria bacterium]|nr:haloacid dehalogenase domain protein hydrolase [Actinomycetota bacterium]